MQRISEETLRSYFNDGKNDFTPTKVLLVLYMLHYSDAIVNFKTDPHLLTTPHQDQQGIKEKRVVFWEYKGFLVWIFRL